MTKYLIDFNTGLVDSVTQVVGQDDATSNEHNDLTTTYTYTTGGGGLPKGLLLTETDPMEIETKYVYGTTLDANTDSVGRVTKVTYAYGRSDASSVQYAYDKYGNLTSVIQDVTGTTQRTTWFGYDALDRVTSMTMPSGAAITYRYNALGNCTAVIDPSGETDYTYDSLGTLLLTVTGADPDGSGPLGRPTTIYAYDADRQLSSVTAPDGGVTSCVRDQLGRVTEIDEPDPDGSGPLARPTIGYGYDAAGNVHTVTDPLGNVTTCGYDGMHRLVTVTEADPGTGSPVTQYGYDYDGELTSVTDPLGRVTTYQYDDLGRETAATAPDPSGYQTSTTTSYAYDDDGNLLSWSDTAHGPTWYTYDDLGEVLTVSNPGYSYQPYAPVTTYTYDKAGDLLTATDPLGHETTYQYYGDGRLETVTEPDPGGSQVVPSTTYTYDWRGDVLSATDALGEETSYTYNALGWCVSQTDPSGNATTPAGPATTYVYDIMGNMKSLTDPDGNVTQWTYDGLGRVKSETDPAAAVTQYWYDADGNLTKTEDRDGRATAYDYDSLNRETAERWLDGSDNTLRTIGYTYDADGELLSATDPGYSAYSYTYGSAGEVDSVTASIAGLTPSVTLNETYDSGGERTLLRAVIGGVHDISIDYGYGADGQVSYMTPSASGGGDGYDYVPYMDIFFYYDLAGQLQSIDRNSEATASYTFDADGRLTSLDYDQGSTALEHYAYTYDGASRVKSMSNSFDSPVTYSYDADGQLTGAEQSYTYDANGNRETAGTSTYGTPGAGNEMTSDGTYTYSYDAEGNRTARFVDTNSNGTLDSGDTDVTEYTWDYRNRLTSVTHYAAYGDTTPTQTVTYTYDVFNHMIGRVVTDTSGTTQTRFIYDGNQVLLQFDGPGGGTGSASDLTGADLSHRYLWGPGVNQLLSDEQLTPLTGGGGYDLTTGGTVVWALGDAQNTIRDLATYDSGVTSIVNHRAYDAYGQLLSQTNPNPTIQSRDCVFGFTGSYTDSATGSVLDWNRWYDPATGGWESQDPIGFGGGDANLSRYAYNDPTSWIDPTGHGVMASGTWGGTLQIGTGTSGFGNLNVETDLGASASGSYRLQFPGDTYLGASQGSILFNAKFWYGAGGRGGGTFDISAYLRYLKDAADNGGLYKPSLDLGSRKHPKSTIESWIDYINYQNEHPKEAKDHRCDQPDPVFNPVPPARY